MPAAPDVEARASSGDARCPIATQPGLGGTADPFSSLLGRRPARRRRRPGLRRPDRHRSSSFSTTAGRWAPCAATSTRAGLRPALEATAETVPTAAPAIERLLANPGLVDGLGSTLGDLVGGGEPGIRRGRPEPGVGARHPRKPARRRPIGGADPGGAGQPAGRGAASRVPPATPPTAGRSVPLASGR